MSPRCEKCGKNVDVLVRSVPKGQIGPFVCLECAPPEYRLKGEVLALVEAITGKENP
jgi:hypothetical protein